MRAFLIGNGYFIFALNAKFGRSGKKKKASSKIEKKIEERKKKEVKKRNKER